jgi:XTP/dITP diphosphohydrolase
VRRRRLIVATGNPGKLREFQALLGAALVDGEPVDLTSLAEMGMPSPEETGSSFLANATLKALHAATLSGLAAIADDSGLEVDALGGAPGIYSARYAGIHGDAVSVDAANNAKLLRELLGRPLHERAARYRCALVFVPAPGDTGSNDTGSNDATSSPVVAEGVWEGFILEAPRGAGGFGYDPYFWLPDLGLTAAQLNPSEKNALSHRGKALRALRDLLKARS